LENGLFEIENDVFSAAMTDDLSCRGGQPTHEALWPADLFTQGIGWVITASSRKERVSKRVSF
jgi:hypothetical protein